MFERFTEKAIKTIMLAQEESRRLGHNFVGSEYILLGLIGEGTGIAARSLSAAGVTLKEARAEVENIIGRGTGEVTAEIPFTPRAKRVFELSWNEARMLNHGYVSTEHLLLGLIRSADGVGWRVLENLHVDAIELRKQVLAALGRYAVPIPKAPLIANETSELASEVSSWYDQETTLLLQRASGIAETAGAPALAPTHILLACLRDNDTIFGALQAGQIDLGQLRREIFSKLEQGSAAPVKSLPFTSETKRLLELAWQKAFALEQVWVKKECVFLALLDEEDGTLPAALKTLGHDGVVLRQFIEDQLNKTKVFSGTGADRERYIPIAEKPRPPLQWLSVLKVATGFTMIALAVIAPFFYGFLLYDTARLPAFGLSVVVLLLLALGISVALLLRERG